MKKYFKFITAVLVCLFVGLIGYGCKERVSFDYEVKFMVDGEKYYSIGTDGEKIAMPKDPVKENMTFDGWYWDDGEWEKEFTLKSITEQPLTEQNRYVVYAKWKGVECFVSFDYADMEKTTVNYGEYFTLSVPRKQGCFFMGWYRDTDDSSVQVTNEYGMGIGNWQWREEVMLSPRWKEYPYTLTFDYGKGVGDVASKRVAYGENIGELPVGRRIGYTFNGWYTQNGEQLTAEMHYEYQRNAEVYARWEVKKVLVTFDFCGGHSVDDPSVTEDTVEVEFGTPYSAVYSLLPEYEYYTFQGWSREREGGNELGSDNDCCLDENAHTFYAQWKILPVRITFDAPGYDGELPAIDMYPGKKIPNLPWNLKRPGYILKAWRVDGYSDWFIDQNYVVDILYDFRLVAEWEEYYDDSADSSLIYAKINAGPCAYDFDGGLLCNLFQNSVVVLDMKTERRLHRFDFTDPVTSIDVCNGRLAVGFLTQKAEVFDLGDYSRLAVVKASSAVNSVALSAASLALTDEDDLIFYNLESKQIYKSYTGVGIGCVRANHENALVYHLQRDGDPVHHSWALTSYAVETGEKRNFVTFPLGEYYEDAFRVDGAYVYVSTERFDALTLEFASFNSMPSEYYRDDFGDGYEGDSLSSLCLLYETEGYAFVYAQRQFRPNGYNGGGEYGYEAIRVYDKKTKEYVKEAVILNLEKWLDRYPTPYLNRFAFENGRFFFYNGNYAGLIEIS